MILIPPWRSVGTDLSVVTMWVGLGLSTAEPHALWFMSTCQLDLARVSEFRSTDRSRTQDTRYGTTDNTIYKLLGIIKVSIKI
jgi:hypothetical protein